MNGHEEHPQEWTREQYAAREAVRDLPLAAARDEFRDELRKRFVDGRLESGSTILPRSRPAHGPNAVPLHRVRPWARYAVPIAVAAALVLMVGVFNRGPEWRVASADGSHVLLDGRRLSCDDLSPIQAALRPECRVEVPEGGRLEVVSDGSMTLQLNGGVQLSLPSPPGRWFARDVVSEFGGNGTMRVVTAGGFQGATYRLRAGDSELLVAGTAFTVMRGDGEICICVLEGEVIVDLASGAREIVTAGRRLTFSEDARSVDRGEMLSTEREALLELRTRAGARSAAS